MQPRIIVNGAKGKMGSLACSTLKNHPDFMIVAQLTRDDDLGNAIADTHANIVLDLTRADCAYQNAQTIIEHGAHPVIGTTGFTEKNIRDLQHQCEAKKLGGLIIPNFSIAAVLMMRFAKEAAYWLPDVEIVETHHPQKADAPSGTAIKTAAMIAEGRQKQPSLSPSKELITGARGATHADTPIHSLRLPGFLAQEQVIFGSIGETLTLSHNCIDRVSFMPGIVLACQRVLKLHSLYYGLEHILNEG